MKSYKYNDRTIYQIHSEHVYFMLNKKKKRTKIRDIFNFSKFRFEFKSGLIYIYCFGLLFMHSNFATVFGTMNTNFCIIEINY